MSHEWIQCTLDRTEGDGSWIAKSRDGGLQVELKDGMQIILDGVPGEIVLSPKPVFLAKQKVFDLFSYGYKKPVKVDCKFAV